MNILQILKQSLISDLEFYDFILNNNCFDKANLTKEEVLLRKQELIKAYGDVRRKHKALQDSIERDKLKATKT